MTITKKRKGFTLIEVIIVVAIIAILAALAIPNVASMINKGKLAAATTDAEALANAINMYNTSVDAGMVTTAKISSSTAAAAAQALIPATDLPKFSKKGTFAAAFANLTVGTDNLAVVKNSEDMVYSSY